MEQIVEKVHTVSSPRVAELEKLLENIFRSVNIALLNEMARLCDRMGDISIWEVVEAAATKPFGFIPFYPGPGLGGHCIPIDPYYLSWLARKYDFETGFIPLSVQTNEGMPFYVVDAIFKGIARQPVRLIDARVLILGAAFKKDVNDVRHSPALRVIEILADKGIRNVSYSDPCVPTFQVANNGQMKELKSARLTAELIESQDVVVIMTDHSAYDYEMIAHKARLIVDTRNAMKDIPTNPEKMMLLGGGDF